MIRKLESGDSGTFEITESDATEIASRCRESLEMWDAVENAFFLYLSGNPTKGENLLLHHFRSVIGEYTTKYLEVVQKRNSENWEHGGGAA